MNTWTPEVAVLTQLVDAVRHNTYITAAVGDQSGKSAKTEPPAPLPRPYSPLEVALKRAKAARRQKSHEDLVGRLLPHRR